MNLSDVQFMVFYQKDLTFYCWKGKNYIDVLDISDNIISTYTDNRFLTNTNSVKEFIQTETQNSGRIIFDRTR